MVVCKNPSSFADDLRVNNPNRQMKQETATKDDLLE